MKTLLTNRPWIPLMLLLIAAAVMSKRSQANPLDTPDKRWHDDITFYVQDTCTAETQDKILAVAQEVATFSRPITYKGTHDGYERDSHNTVGCALDSPFVSDLQSLQANGLVHEDHSLTVERDGQLFTYGTARTWSFPNTGEIVEFDIWLSSTWMLVDSIAWQTIRHEWGHALGLSHSEYSESLMYRSNGPEEWDIETIAKLSLSYGRCEAHVDDNLNLWLPSLTVEGRDVYAVMPVGAAWPDDVFWFGDATADCTLEPRPGR